MMVTIPRILTCSNDRTVCLLSLAPGTMRATLECRLCGHHGTVCSVAAKDDKVLTGSVDKTVKLWTVQQGVDNRILHTFTGHYKRVRIRNLIFVLSILVLITPSFFSGCFPHEYSLQIPHFLSSLPLNSLLLSLLYQPFATFIFSSLVLQINHLPNIQLYLISSSHHIEETF